MEEKKKYRPRNVCYCENMVVTEINKPEKLEGSMLNSIARIVWEAYKRDHADIYFPDRKQIIGKEILNEE